MNVLRSPEIQYFFTIQVDDELISQFSDQLCSSVPAFLRENSKVFKRVSKFHDRPKFVATRPGKNKSIIYVLIWMCLTFAEPSFTLLSFYKKKTSNRINCPPLASNLQNKISPLLHPWNYKKKHNPSLIRRGCNRL